MSFTYDFGQSHANAAYKGKTTVNTKLFINGEWVEGSGEQWQNQESRSSTTG